MIGDDIMKWNSELYDNAQAFVSEYGKGLITFIPQKENQKILDLGCGTGDLTWEIAKTFSCNVVGSDYSKEMIVKAKEKYPTLEFSVCDACKIPFTNEFDTIFSNAVFHWIPDQNALHQSIYNALKTNGMLICEFGGYKNIQNISNAFGKAIAKYGDNYASPFYFPKVENHVEVLENTGFVIEKIYDYDRPTILPNDDMGLRQWVCQFFSADLFKYEDDKQEEILSFVENELRATMFAGEKWTADYRRLRVVAHK